MKDFEVNKEDKDDEIAIHADRKEITLINSQKWVKGLNVFELDMETFGVKQVRSLGNDAEIVPEKNMITGQLTGKNTTVTRRKYPVKEKCKYVQATNLKNATKKFKKYLISTGQIN